MFKKIGGKMVVFILLICITGTSIGIPMDVYGETIQLDITQALVTGEYAFDLSKAGNIDWLHLKGNGVDSLTQIKKKGSSSITFSTKTDTSKEGKSDKGGDSNYISYTWNDGMSGYENGTDDTGFGVFFPKNTRDKGTCENVGWDFTVISQSQEVTVAFAIGMWQTKVHLKFYANNELVTTKQIEATTTTSQVYRYQVKLPANTTLKVEGIQTEAKENYGNFSLSGVVVGNKEVVDKNALQSIYNSVKDMVQDLYTDSTWKTFINAKTNAKIILAKTDATSTEVSTALTTLTTAINGLTKKASNIMVDFTGSAKNEYGFGHEGDQQDRYQTFTAKESFDMEYVQVNVKKMATDISDLVVKLYATDNTGLPINTPLAETTVSKDNVADGGLTTAKLSYKLVKDTRYVIVLTQSNLANEKYRWMVMDKTTDSKNEYFGKSVSGEFIPEASLGTGILRIVKKSTIDKSALQTLITNTTNYNDRIYTVQSWSSFKNALSNANTIINKFDATQTEVDTAKNNLQTAINNLALNITIDEINSQIAILKSAVIKGYTDSSVNVLKEKIKVAAELDNTATDNDKITAHTNILNAIKNLKTLGQYKYETNPLMIAAFGFEGDKNAPLTFLDGSYQIGGARPEQHGPVKSKEIISFGVTDTSDIKWYNKEGYLPCFVSEYTKYDMQYKIENFANKATVNSKDYVIAYSRVTTTNNSTEDRFLPLVSDNLIPLNDAAKNTLVIEAGETVVRDYAIEADKYEYFKKGVTEFTDLTYDQVINQGSFDENYTEMKTYWDTELKEHAVIDLPNKELVNAYKAGYIYTMIIKDNTYLHVGENGYARLYSHDTLGILVQLIQSGDFEQAKNYLESVPLTGGKNIETGMTDGNLYWDANWKLPWAYAVYLSKTGDISIFNETMIDDNGSPGTIFDKRVKFGARSIETDRRDNGDGDNDKNDGIMKNTMAIDANGQWTIDNYSALTGLTSYEYICRELYKSTKSDFYIKEAEWAKAEYDDLLDAFTKRLQQTITEKGLNYIPVSVVQSNNQNRTSDPRDANWASMFLFGRWTWDGYLYGAEQPEDNINLSMIDQTYTYGINRRMSANATDSPYNFGGYPHGFYSSSYNAGYGSAALRGEQYRDMGIKAYEFMIENSMSGLFSWWEGVYYPEKGAWVKTNDKLSVQNTPGGGGSSQHMWGQSVNSKVLLDSLIAERIYNQNQNIDIILGRGIPKEWVVDAAANNNIVADVQNYPVLQGGRVGYKIVRDGKDLIVTLNSNFTNSKIDSTTTVNFSVQLPSMVNNITKVSAGDIDNPKGIVTIPVTTNKVTITLGDIIKPIDKHKLQLAYESVKELKQGVYTDVTWKEFESARVNAKVILENTKATEQEINTSLETLNNAKNSLAKIGSPLTIDKNQVKGAEKINLTEIGSVDWMHLKGDGNNFTQIKKANSDAITFGYEGVDIEGKLSTNDTNRISYSWTDGMIGNETGTNDTGFGVFFPKGSTNAGIYNDVKWNFTVKPQSQDTTVVFAMGMWNAKVDVNFYVDDQLVDISQIQAGGTAETFKYKVQVPANKTLKVEANQIESISNWGNFSFSGVAVNDRKEPFTVDSNKVIDRTAGIKATVDVSPTQGQNEHKGQEAVVFQLMKGNTPINIISLTHDINSETELTVEFNVSDPNNSEYTVKVLVLDQLDNTNNGSISLASPTILK